MKTKLLLLSLALATTSAFAQQTLGSGIDKANMDLTVKPGNDFYRYAAGGWMKSHPLDAEHPMNGAFVDLEEQNQKRIQELINEFATKPQQKGSLGQKIGSIYNLMMDSVRLNREGAAPLKPYLAKVAAIKNIHEYQYVTSSLDFEGIGTLMFDMGVGADQRNASMNIVGIGQGGLGLGERDYYLNDDEQTVKVRNAYKELITTLFKLVGNDEATATKKMEAVMAIETRLAKASYGAVKLRDINANYHKMSYMQLVNDYPGIDWGNIFLAQGFPVFDSVDVGQPEPIHEVEKILAETPLDDLKAYAESRVISSGTSTLSDEFRAAAFKFSSVLSGVSQDRPRWKRSVSAVSGLLGEAIGKMYVEKYFPESSKKRMLELVHNLQTALAQRIDEATWMGEATKAQAKDKLQNFIVKIGYPDKWRDYSGLQVDDSLSLYENLRAISRYKTTDYLTRKVSKPVDKSEWQMTPQTINAYYNPTTNEICFPAGILQKPFFDMNADDAFNYGAIGVVIGHEMTHGFDDQGRHYDKNGNMTDWWTADDAKNFTERAARCANFFSNIKVLPDLNGNGSLTLGENLADHGGLQVSFNAFKHATADKPLETINGFTPEQRFFLAYSGVWAGNITEKEIRSRTKSDPHSLGQWRVDGALPHINAWYEAFDIKPDNKMFIPETERVDLW